MSSPVRTRAPRRLLAAALTALLVPITWVALPAPSAQAAEVFTPPASGAWSIEGAGWGHGIGLSQWGAQGAASVDGLAPHQILGFYYPGTVLEPIPAQNIRVQLTGFQGTSVTFGVEGTGDLGVIDTSNGQSTVLPKLARYRVTVDGNGLHLDGGDGTSWSPLAINGQTTFGGPLNLSGTDGVWLYDGTGAGRLYREQMRFVKMSATSVQAVNDVGMNAYLRGVVPRESPSSFHTNALQAQAVAARSYAKAVSQANKPWDICDTTQCQVYGGWKQQTAAGARTDLEAASTNAAIDATQLIVVKESAGGPVAFTQFSASNGGHSVAGSKPYLVAKPDPYSGKANGDPVSRWTGTLNVATMQQQCPSGTFQSFEIVSRDGKGPFGGRITRLRVNCTGGSKDITSTSELAFGMRHRMWRVSGTTTPAGPEAPGILSRLEGADRFATAANIAKGSFSTTDVALLARGDGATSFADGLSANFLAGVQSAPTLLTNAANLPQVTLDALKSMQVKTVRVLGGTTAVSAAVVTALQDNGFTVERIEGPDRYATAAAVARNGAASIGSHDGKKTAILSSGVAFPDALASGGIVYAKRFPQLLTEPGALPGATSTVLTELGIQHVIITGGTTAISTAVEDAVKALGMTVERAQGATRWDTAVVLADLAIDRYGFSASHVDVASGENFPDALTAGPHSGKAQAPLVLTARTAAPQPTCAFLTRRTAISSGHVFGGTVAIDGSGKGSVETCLSA